MCDSVSVTMATQRGGVGTRGAERPAGVRRVTDRPRLATTQRWNFSVIFFFFFFRERPNLVLIADAGSASSALSAD